MNHDEITETISKLSAERIESNHQSWVRVEKFFREQSTGVGSADAAPVYEFIKQIIVTDLIKLFRASTSMWTLRILTEIEEYVTHHQPFIAIEVEEDILQIKYMHTDGNVVLQKEACDSKADGLIALEPYLVRLWKETKEHR
jgi:hypothetical protein